MTFIETLPGLIVLVIITILWALLVLAVGWSIIDEATAWMQERTEGGEGDEVF